MERVPSMFHTLSKEMLQIITIENPKYANLKEEVLMNGDNEISPRYWNNLIVIKSEQLMNTEKVKSTQWCGQIGSNMYKAQYAAYWGKKQGEPMKIHHIQSLICYTDFSG